MKVVKYLLLLISLSSVSTLANENFVKFTNLLIGELAPNDINNNSKLSHKNNQQHLQYNQELKLNWQAFKQNFVEPINYFYLSKLKPIIEGKSLFYPFSGPDISYPILLFPEIENYILIGMEFPGNPEVTLKTFSLKQFTPQIKGYLESGFFKTMKMSSQIYYNEGVIPVLVAQIGLLGGMVHDITITQEPYKGIIVSFTYQQKIRTLYYYRANLDDLNISKQLFEFIQEHKFTDNCMLKASSYKLHQIDFKLLRHFMLDNCSTILQDDTGMPLNYLQLKKYQLYLFGNYVHAYGNEFKSYDQQALAKLYNMQNNKDKLDFCYGYGCRKVEANILVAKKIMDK